ncbi:sensor histidine kinase [Novosphingobium lentum]|uniref:sensor histidine kinase n=1 Tax=Novosphingobium lentum TaxID=145287 RepID=UPI00083382D2|nr:sensor histidine kinase [Novosphingobium lentum]
MVGCVVIAATGLAVLIAIRALVDLWEPGAAPYAMIYPIIFLATAVGRLRAGLLTWVVCMVYSSLIVMPLGRAVVAEAIPTDPRTVINALVGLFMVIVTEAARRQAAELIREREARIAERDMLLREVDHRLKNNFAMFGSLLSLQQREARSDEARDILARATARLHSLSQAYDHLRYEPGSITVLDISVLLQGLARSLRDVLGLDGKFSLDVEAGPRLIARDRASALALLVNELVTNAAKHAFADREGGEIRIVLVSPHAESAVIEIADNGIGLPSESTGSGQGRKLVEVLAQMAGGTLAVDSDATGTSYRIALEALP